MVNEDEIKINVGKRVKTLRLQKKLTQKKLAEYIDVQPRTISAIEKGQNFVSADVLAKLSNYFEVSSSYFLTPQADTYSFEESNYISKIKELLPLFNNKKLKTIYNVLLVLLDQ